MLFFVFFKSVWYRIRSKTDYSLSNLSKIFNVSSDYIFPVSGNEFTVPLLNTSVVPGDFIIHKIKSKEKGSFDGQMIVLSTPECMLPCRIVTRFGYYSIVEHCSFPINKIKCVRQASLMGSVEFNTHFHKSLELNGIEKYHGMNYTQNLTGFKQCIAIVDSGVDRASRWLRNEKGNKVKKITHYLSFGDNTDDFEGHGTFLAGVAAGRSDCKDGSFMFNGIAPDAHLVVADIMDNQSRINWPANFSDLFTVPSKLGCKIHLNSWTSDTKLLTTAIDYLAFKNPHMVIIFPANHKNRTLSPPGNSKNVLTVGSVYGNKLSKVFFDRNATINVHIHIDTPFKSIDLIVQPDNSGPSLHNINIASKFPMVFNKQQLSKGIFNVVDQHSAPLPKLSLVVFVFHNQTIKTKFGIPTFRLPPMYLYYVKNAQSIQIGFSQFENDDTDHEYNDWDISYGSKDGQIKPEIVIPGGPIIGPKSLSGKCGIEGLTMKAGPSVSSAIAAGYAALIAHHFSNQTRPINKIGSSLMRALLVNSAREKLLFVEDSFQLKRGWGIPNISNVFVPLLAKQSQMESLFVQQYIPIENLETVTHAFISTAEGRIRATISWLDYPCDPSSNRFLATPLTLYALIKNEVVLSNQNQMEVQHLDRSNTIQHLEFSIPKGTHFSIVVSARKFSYISKSNYSIVVSGAMVINSKGNNRTGIIKCPVKCNLVNPHAICVQNECMCSSEYTGDFCQFKAERYYNNSSFFHTFNKMSEWFIIKIAPEKWTPEMSIVISHSFDFSQLSLFIEIGKSPNRDSIEFSSKNCDDIIYNDSSFTFPAKNWPSLSKWNPMYIGLCSKVYKGFSVEGAIKIVN